MARPVSHGHGRLHPSYKTTWNRPPVERDLQSEDKERENTVIYPSRPATPESEDWSTEWIINLVDLDNDG